MRIAAAGILVTVAALGAASSAQAQAGTMYGGSAVVGVQLATPTISLLAGADGGIVARAGTAVDCRKHHWTNQVVRITGHATGGHFTATGHTSLDKRHRLRVKLTGTIAGAVISGRYVERLKGCKGKSRKFVLHAQATPSGAGAKPPVRTLMYGLTSQGAGALKLPVALRVNADGKLYATWQALAQCSGAGRVPVMNSTPLTKIRADGTFSRSERYTIRYTDGSHDVFRVTFAGQFVPGGAVGTLTARTQLADRKHLYAPCISGTQHWSATM
jgi:hypothetical protein